MICANARQSELEKMGASALSKLVIAQMGRIEHLELQLAKMQRTLWFAKMQSGQKVRCPALISRRYIRLFEGKGDREICNSAPRMHYGKIRQ
jgi:hypothetical protein